MVEIFKGNDSECCGAYLLILGTGSRRGGVIRVR